MNRKSITGTRGWQECSEFSSTSRQSLTSADAAAALWPHRTCPTRRLHRSATPLWPRAVRSEPSGHPRDGSLDSITPDFDERAWSTGHMGCGEHNPPRPRAMGETDRLPPVDRYSLGDLAYRLVYCGALRARLSPTFLRSFIRASRVRRPARFSDGRNSSSARVSARAIPWRTAPA
jgi:hypothetical protein